MDTAIRLTTFNTLRESHINATEEFMKDPVSIKALSLLIEAAEIFISRKNEQG